MAQTRASNGHARRGAVAWLRGQRLPCWICGLPIDYGAPAHHPMSFECDELVPVSKGGSPTDRANIAAAHACCNNWRKAKSVETVQASKAAVLRSLGRWTTPQQFVSAAKRLKANARCDAPRPAHGAKGAKDTRLTW